MQHPVIAAKAKANQHTNRKLNSFTIKKKFIWLIPNKKNLFFNHNMVFFEIMKQK